MQNYYQTFYGQEREAKEGESMLYLRPEQIKLPQNAQKARKNQNAIIRLAASIKQYGLLEPLSVRIAGEERGMTLYELVDGKRRLDAALIAGLNKIPCKILPQNDKTYALAGIFESLRSKKLHIFEQAAGFRLLMDDFSLTQEEIAERLGISQSTVANKLRLLQFSREEQQDILEAGLTERHARTILRLKTPELRQIAIYRTRTEHLNVAATEALVEQMLAADPQNTPKSAPESAKSAPLTEQNTPKRPQGTLSGAFFEEDAPERGEAGGGVKVVRHEQQHLDVTTPHKFALPDLTPLYNSIDRTLAIFRKTGAEATCSHEESQSGVRIIIEIPRNA